VPRFLVCLFVLPACMTSTPVLEDSLGTRVQWMCEAGMCQVSGASVAPPVCGDNDIFVVGAGAIAVLCGASVAMDHSFTIDDANCRPLICASSDDCPQWPDRRYGCDGGFCTTSALALDRIDIVATCLRTVPRDATCAAADADPMVVAARANATAACSSSGCTIPASCRP